MRCPGCCRDISDDAESFTERYGKLWCEACLSRIEFEERLAATSRMTVRDVFVSGGQISYVFDKLDGGEFTSADLATITANETDVLLEVLEAARALHKNLVTFGGVVVSWTSEAPEHARSFVALAGRLQPLLAVEQQQDLAAMLQVARFIASAGRA